MAEEQYTTDERESKAWKRILAAAKKLAARVGNAELGETVTAAHHADRPTRDMRRFEALAALLEALVASDAPAPEPKTVKAEKVVKAES